MRDGLDADDAWRLVEDEFEVTAKLFTRHLHHAEYQRLKRLAKTRNQGAVDAITGIEPQALRAEGDNHQDPVQAHLLRPAMNNSRTEVDMRSEDLRLNDPKLAGLMSHKQKDKAPLTKIGALQSSSRAAHGFSQGQASPPKRRKYASMQVDHHAHDEDGTGMHATNSMDDGSEDLDLPTYRASAPHQGVKALARAKSHPKGGSVGLRKDHASRQNAGSQLARSDMASKSSSRPGTDVTMASYGNDDDDDDFDPFVSRRTGSTQSKLSSGEGAQSGNKKQERRTSFKADEIPTFLV
jgi:hypothetical protein